MKVEPALSALVRTATARATIAVLDINEPDAVTVRAALIDEGVFPPRKARSR